METSFHGLCVRVLQLILAYESIVLCMCSGNVLIGYWRVTSMGNTGINRVMRNKGKSPSHLHISFATKKLPPTLPHQGLDISYSYVPPKEPLDHRETE